MNSRQIIDNFLESMLAGGSKSPGNNPCHAPAGSKEGGQFCSGPGSGERESQLRKKTATDEADRRAADAKKALIEKHEKAGTKYWQDPEYMKLAKKHGKISQEQTRRESYIKKTGSGEGVKLGQSARGRIQRGIHDLLKPNYFESIPLDKIDEILRGQGYLLVQEDNTPWSGFLTGKKGDTAIDIGVLDDFEEKDGMKMHRPVKDAMIRLSWYKMPSGKWEVTGYLT